MQFANRVISKVTLQKTECVERVFFFSLLKCSWVTQKPPSQLGRSFFEALAETKTAARYSMRFSGFSSQASNRQKMSKLIVHFLLLYVASKKRTSSKIRAILSCLVQLKRVFLNPLRVFDHQHDKLTDTVYQVEEHNNRTT